MLSIVISNNHTIEDLNFTLKSICAACCDRSSVKLFITDYTNDPESKLSIAKNFNTEFLSIQGCSSIYYDDILKKIDSDYVIFVNSGELFTKGFFNLYNKIINSDYNTDYKCLLAFNPFTITYDLVKKYSKKAKNSCKKAAIDYINLSYNPECVPLEATGVVFRTADLRKVGINNDLKYDALKNAMLRILNATGCFVKAGNIEDEIFISPYPVTTDKVNFPGMHDIKWYIDALEKFVLPLVNDCKDNNKTKNFIQYVALYEVKWRYIYNINSDNKHIVDKVWAKFFDLCKNILSHIDDEFLFNLRNIIDFKMVKGLSFALFYTKHGTDVDSKYFYDKKSIARICKNIIVMHASELRVILEILEYKQKENILLLEASVDSFLDMDNCGLNCYLDVKQIEIIPTYRYAHTKYFGKSTNKRYTFKVEIPLELIDTSKQHKLTFFVTYKDYSVQIPYVTRKYTSMVATHIPYSYWKFADNDRAVYFSDDYTELIFTQIKGFARFRREILMILSMLYGPQKSIRMFLTRICYWLTRPYFRNKKIWLTYDKLYKGGDCGEYFYKYMLSQNDGITPAYVINRDSEDAKRLRKEGIHPLYFGTMKNKLYYINADVVFATHGGVHTFNGISNSQAKYVSDLIHADVTCIQHGLSVQQLAQELNRVYNNTKRYYCASKYEIKNLEHPIYNYVDKSSLRLTGIPRYDGLVSNDCKQILITPTWRAYISMPPVMGQSRPYYPEFKKTNYYKLYYNLLTDNKLIETARRTGYKIIYLLHPIISSQIIDYPEIDGVEIIPATTVNYEKILTESSLMLTDYSGVQFDFAYMRKPVVYYHPPKLPPHYKEGGFFYDSMGFGEICTEHKEIVNCLCDYMENNCELKPFYKKRADDFFAFSDHKSCERIYNDMVNYQKENGKF